MGLSEWPGQTDLIFLRIPGPGTLENARLLNFNRSLTLPTKMQIGNAEQPRAPGQVYVISVGVLI